MTILWLAIYKKFFIFFLNSEAEFTASHCFECFDCIIYHVVSCPIALA